MDKYPSTLNDVAPLFGTETANVSVYSNTSEISTTTIGDLLDTPFIEKVLAKSEIAGKPTVILLQVQIDLWEVQVGSSASTWEVLDNAVYEFADSVRSYQSNL